MRNVPITIVGAGAIGGTVGAYLDDASYDVTLVDTSREHVEAIRGRGLRITGVRGERTFRPRVALPEEFKGTLGATFLCVKGHFTEEAMGWVEPRLEPDGYVLSLQNGLNEERISERVGAGRTVGAFVHFGADLLEPGLVQLGYEAKIHVGELDGRITARVEALAAALGHAMPAEVTSNVWGYLWGKLIFGATGFVVSCVDAPVAEVIDDPLGRALCRTASAEAFAVARTRTAKVEPIGDFDPESFAPGDGMEARADAALKGLADSWRGAIKQHMGIWRDLKVERRKTEVDEQVGRIVVAGQERGVSTPVNEAVLGIVHEIEAGERSMGWDNLEEMARRSGLASPAR